MSDFNLDRSRLPADTCEHLRTKTMYTGSESKRAFTEYAGANISTAAFWCVFTQMPWGEDQLEVGPELCRPGRPCCQAPLSTPPQV